MKVKNKKWSNRMENKPMKLLLIEDDVKECSIYQEIDKLRKDIEFVAITNSDVEAIKHVKKYLPEGIILDLELTKGHGTGFDFLNQLQLLKLPIVPKVIVTTNVCSDSVYEYLHKNGVDFVFYKKQENYSQEKVINTLLLLRQYKNNITQTIVIDNEKEIKDITSEKINEELDLIGISTHLQGRKYLHDAIQYIIENEKENNKITVVQFLVSKYKKSNSTISRAMQNAILHAWRVSAIDDLNTYYTARINYETGVPTPTEFIYYYSNKIKKLI